VTHENIQDISTKGMKQGRTGLKRSKSQSGPASHSLGLAETLLNGNGDVWSEREECVIVGAPDMTPTATEGLNWIDFLSSAGAHSGR
jgi:hypothetical protein